MNERKNVLGVYISFFDKVEILDAIQYCITTDNKMIVLSGNIYSLNLAYQQEWLRNFFNQADIVCLDGAGVKIGASILGYKILSRITWADFTWILAEYAKRHGFTFFFLGASPDVAAKAAANLKVRLPDMYIVGIHHG